MVTETDTAFQRRAQAELDSMRAQLDQLEADMRKADAAARSSVEDRVAEMRARVKEAEGRMKDFGETGLSAIAKIKTGFDMAFEDIQRAFEGGRTGVGRGHNGEDRITTPADRS